MENPENTQAPQETEQEPTTSAILWGTQTCDIEVEANGVLETQTIVVRYVSMDTLDSVLSFATEVIDSLQMDKGMPGIDILDPAQILKLISKHKERTIEVVLALSSIDKETLSTLRIDHFVALASAVFRLNQSFFEQRVKQLLGL